MERGHFGIIVIVGFTNGEREFLPADIDMIDVRERRFEHLREATGENTKSKILGRATDFYCQMADGEAYLIDGTTGFGDYRSV